MLHEFEITLKHGAPCRLIDEDGLIKRWKDARKTGDEYLDTECGSLLVESILSINDRHKIMKAAATYNSQRSEQVKDKARGLFVPGGDILRPA